LLKVVVPGLQRLGSAVMNITGAISVTKDIGSSRAGLSNYEALGKVHWEAPKRSGFNRFIIP